MTTTAETDTTTEELDEIVTAPLPFLKITARYGGDGDRYETLELELNFPGDEIDVADYEPQDPANLKSWFTDFCTQVLRELRSPAAPAMVVLSGRLREMLAAAAAEPAAEPADEQPADDADDDASKGGA